MYYVRKMRVKFKNGDVKELNGVFKSKERMIYEVDGDGETKAVINFDVVSVVEFLENNTSIKLIS